MSRIGRTLALQGALLLGGPLLADGFQSRTEAAFAQATSPAAQDQARAAACQEGLALLPGESLAGYLDRARRARVLKAGATVPPPDLDLRPEPYLARARRRQAQGGMGLELPPAYHRDLDRGIALKHAAVLQDVFLEHLATADLAREARDPRATYAALMGTLAGRLVGYTTQDYLDIFSFQAPGATPAQLDEDIFSLYQTLRRQEAARPVLARLVAERLAPATSLEETHLELARCLADLAFGPPGPPQTEPAAPETLAEARRSLSGWALRQGLARALCLGEELACRYARELGLPAGRAALRRLQARLRHPR